MVIISNAILLSNILVYILVKFTDSLQWLYFGHNVKLQTVMLDLLFSPENDQLNWNKTQVCVSKKKKKKNSQIRGKWSE